MVRVRKILKQHFQCCKRGGHSGNPLSSAAKKKTLPWSVFVVLVTDFLGRYKKVGFRSLPNLLDKVKKAAKTLGVFHGRGTQMACKPCGEPQYSKRWLFWSLDRFYL